MTQAQIKTRLKPWTEICEICLTRDHLSDLKICLPLVFKNSINWPNVGDLNHIARSIESNFPWIFVKQHPVPRRAKSRGTSSLTGYLQAVMDEGQIPVRENNLHDVLNAFSFMMFPRSKKALSYRHRMESPEGLKPGQNRTRTQDLLTIFDEGGVIRLTNSKGITRDLIFGHAIYEHIIHGLNLRAARLNFSVDDQIFSEPIQEVTRFADALLAAWLSNPAHCHSAQEFSSVEISQ